MAKSFRATGFSSAAWFSTAISNRAKMLTTPVSRPVPRTRTRGSASSCVTSTRISCSHSFRLIGLHSENRRSAAGDPSRNGLSAPRGLPGLPAKSTSSWNSLSNAGGSAPGGVAGRPAARRLFRRCSGVRPGAAGAAPRAGFGGVTTSLGAMTKFSLLVV